MQHLRSLGFRIIAFVDELGGTWPAGPGLRSTPAEATTAYEVVAALRRHLFRRLHPTKGMFHGTTAIKLLGHVMDTAQVDFRLPANHKDQLMGMVRALSLCATNHRFWVSFHAFRRFCGTAVSTMLSVPSARHHLRSLFISLQQQHHRCGDCRLGHEAVRDLLSWVKLRCNSASGSPICPEASSVLMYTDASTLGWGAVLSQAAKARGSHAVHRNGLHINCFELRAIMLALRSFHTAIPPGTSLRLRSDSMVALGVLNAGSSRSPVLMSQYRKLRKLFYAMRVELRAEHVSFILNVWADRLSRKNDSMDWSTRIAAFHRLDRRYGPHSEDMFATKFNARLRPVLLPWLWRTATSGCRLWTRRAGTLTV